MRSIALQADHQLDPDARVGLDAVLDAALFGYFVEARSRARGPIICLNSRELLPNAAAARLVEDGDGATLWRWALRRIDAGDRSGQVLRLRNRQLRLECEAIYAGPQLIGALVRIDHARRAVGRSSGRRVPKRRRDTFGWESLRDSELGIAQFVAAGLTNREIGAHLYLSRHTVDFHLRQIFRKLGIASRVELARLVVEHAEAVDFAPSI
jgi:DNA-binding CsgD family transcriptional regulator